MARSDRSDRSEKDKQIRRARIIGKAGSVLAVAGGIDALAWGGVAGMAHRAISAPNMYPASDKLYISGIRSKGLAGVVTGAVLSGVGTYIARKQGKRIRALSNSSDEYDKGDVWGNPDEVVAQKEYKAFHDPKGF